MEHTDTPAQPATPAQPDATELLAIARTYPLARARFEAAELVAAYPPRVRDRNKRLVFDATCGPGAAHRGALSVTRWRPIPPPVQCPSRASAPAFDAREGVFSYEPLAAPDAANTVEWYLNFADRQLFVAYGSGLLAQDEMQVAEHPVLGSLREALLDARDPAFAPMTRDELGWPTPFTIRGVERRCALATDPDVDANRPYGLYGNRFSRAPIDAIRNALRVLEPPTVTNILAMEALPGGVGRYRRIEIEVLLVTAWTGFVAARAASLRESGATTDARVVVHTGGWGTGAYGGNRTMMALVQLVAAHLAGLSGVVYHTLDGEASRAYDAARERFDAVIPVDGTIEFDAVVDAIDALGLAWGLSDGN